MLATAALLGACTGPSGPPPSAINVSDSGVLVPSARVSIPLGRSPAPPSATRAGQAIELGASIAKGEDSQSLAAGANPIRFGGATFSAPQQLSYEFDFTYLEAAYRWRYFQDNGPLGLELRGGLGYGSLGLKVASPSRQASESMSSVGVSLGAGLVFRLAPHTGVHARFTLFDSGSETELSSAQRFELFLTRDLNPHLALRGGYVSWRAESEGNTSSRSQVRARLSGAMVGLEATF